MECTVSQDDLDRVMPELDSDESVYWTGRPSASALGWQRGGLQTLAMVFFTAFVTAWCILVGSFLYLSWPNMPWPILILPVGGIALLVYGLTMLIAVLRRLLSARSVIYALTDRRAVILEGNGDIQSFSLSELETLQRRGGRRKGSLLFRDYPMKFFGFMSHWYLHWPDRGFIGIENPREVERLIRDKILRK